MFLAAYLLNIFYITVLYHRGLTHGAVRLRPFTRNLLIHTGNWVTGLDPKGWACMHRLHHMHSDTALDPHRPVAAALPVSRRGRRGHRSAGPCLAPRRRVLPWNDEPSHPGLDGERPRP